MGCYELDSQKKGFSKIKHRPPVGKEARTVKLLQQTGTSWDRESDTPTNCQDFHLNLQSQRCEPGGCLPNIITTRPIRLSNCIKVGLGKNGSSNVTNVGWVLSTYVESTLGISIYRYL